MVPYRLFITRKAQKELDSLPRDIQQHIRSAIRSLAKNPRPDGSKKLKGKDASHRLRVGNYRVIYEIQDDRLIIIIIRIRHRREVY